MVSCCHLSLSYWEREFNDLVIPGLLPGVGDSVHGIMHLGSYLEPRCTKSPERDMTWTAKTMLDHAVPCKLNIVCTCVYIYLQLKYTYLYIYFFSDVYIYFRCACIYMYVVLKFVDLICMHTYRNIYIYILFI